MPTLKSMPKMNLGKQIRPTGIYILEILGLGKLGRMKFIGLQEEGGRVAN